VGGLVSGSLPTAGAPVVDPSGAPVTELEGDLDAPPDPSGAPVTDPPSREGGSVIVVDPSGAPVPPPVGAPVVVVVDPSGVPVALVVVGDGFTAAIVGLIVGTPDVGVPIGSPALISAPTVINASFISSHTYRRYSITSGPGSSSGPVPFVRIPTSPSPAVQHPLRTVNFDTAALLLGLLTSLLLLSRPAGYSSHKQLNTR
jgi:hypothetical protein